MNQSQDESKPSNSKLDALASLAEVEDGQHKTVEQEAEQARVDAEQEAEQETRVDQEAARQAAEAFIGSASWAVETFLQVQYDENTRRRGVEAMSPLFESGSVVPGWMVQFVGAYRPYFVAGGFLVATGIATYGIIQQQKAAQAASQQGSEPEREPVPEPAPHHGEGIGEAMPEPAQPVGEPKGTFRSAGA